MHDTARWFVRPWIRYPIASGVSLWSPADGEGVPVKLDALTQQVLNLCRGARTLDEHARSIARVRGVTVEVRPVLERLRQNGMLAALPEPHTDAASARRFRRAASIAAAGIPTADRPRAARQAVAGALRHMERRGGRIRLFLLDGSRRAGNRRAMRGLIERSQRHVPGATYVGAAARDAICARLEREGFARRVLTEALGGSQIGHHRNLLLLLTAGTSAVMADDDIQLRLWRHEGREDGIAIGAHEEPRLHEFCAQRTDAIAHCLPAQGDLFTVHERVLGCDGEGLLAGGADVSDACAHLLDALARRRALRVRVTMTGIAGDSGVRCPHRWLTADGLAREALLSDAGAFETAMTSREIRRIARRTTVTHDRHCMAGCMAVDNRTPLPPFMWIGRNEDGVFGSTLTATDPAALLAHLSTGVVHDSHRTSARQTRAIISATRTHVSDLLLSMIGGLPRSAWHVSSERRLDALARRFLEIAALSPGSFDDAVRRFVLDARAEQLARLSHIADGASYPSYWQSVAHVYKETCVASMSKPIFTCPVEFRVGRSSSKQAYQALRAFLQTFGELLQIWPDLWAAARNLGPDALIGRPTHQRSAQ